MKRDIVNRLKTIAVFVCILLIITTFSSAVSAEKQSDYNSKNPIQKYTTFKGISQTPLRDKYNLPGDSNRDEQILDVEYNRDFPDDHRFSLPYGKTFL